MGVVAGIAAAGLATTIGSQVAGGGGSGSSASPGQTYGGNPATYIPSAQPGMDQNYQNLIGSQMPYAMAMPGQQIPQWQQFQPQAQQYLSNIVNNPYQGTANDYASMAGTDASAMAGRNFTEAGMMDASGNTLGSYLPGMLQTGFDPRRALYNQSENDLTQQINAQLAANNQFGTPVGAGVAANALGRFNIDWQNQQLQRQIAASQGASGLAGGQAGAYGASNNLGQAGVNFQQQAGQLPYQTYMGQQQTNLGALGTAQNAFGQNQQGMNNAFAQPNATISNMLPYMQLGQNATAGALAGQAQGFNQNQQLGQGFGNALSQAQSAFGKPSSWFGSSGGGSDPNMMNYGGGSPEIAASGGYGYF